MIKIVDIRENAIVYQNDHGQLYLCLHPRLFHGLKVSPFTCFKRYNFCKKDLHRPHLTCFWCEFRKPSKKPIPISIALVVVRADISWLRKLLVKKLVSLAEAIGGV